MCVESHSQILIGMDDDDSPEQTDKRPRTFQDDVIEATIAEEEARKKARKAEKGGAPKSQGKTLQEIEVGWGKYQILIQICMVAASSIHLHATSTLSIMLNYLSHAEAAGVYSGS